METKEAIKKIRISKGYSQQQIADILKTTQQQYSKYETGAQEIPIRHIITLCDKYKVTANEMLGIETYMTKEENNNKFQKLYDSTIDIIYWAEYQKHIKEDAATILIENITEEKDRIEKEE